MFTSGVRLGNRYRLDQPLASGGMSEVWKGHDTILRRDVALKLLHPHLAVDPVVVERFRREAVAAAGLAHPNIVPTFDTGEDDTGAYIVMGLVQGPTLKDAIAAGAPLVIDHIGVVARQVADALAHAHGRGIVHRDIKPANILVVDSTRVMVTDFGIAKAVADVAEAALTMPGLVVATPGYSAPEQLRGEITDARVDIYALGVLIHEMCCGHTSHTMGGDETTTLAASEHNGGPLDCTSLPDEFKAIVGRCVADDPDDRYPSAEDLITDLSVIERSGGHHKTAATSVTGRSSADATVTIPARTRKDAKATKAGGFRQSSTPLPTTSGSRRRRSIATIVVVALIIGALAIGQVARTMGNAEPEQVAVPTAPVELTASSFDPFGSNGQEHEAEAPRAIDNNAATAWTTETYVDRTMNKPGVGLALRSPTSSSMRALEVQSRSTGWTAQIFVANGSPDQLESWGDPVDTQSGLGNSARFDLKGRTGDSVLLWITDLGQSRQFEATEVRIVADTA